MHRHTILTRLLALSLLFSLIMPQIPLLHADDPMVDLEIKVPTIATETYGYASLSPKVIELYNPSATNTAYIKELKLLPASNLEFELIDLPAPFPKLDPASSFKDVKVQIKSGLAVGTYTASLVAYYDWNQAGDGDEEAIAALSFQVDKATQTAPAAPTLAAKTSSSITLEAIESEKTVEYAYHTSDSAPTTGWQTGLTFASLLPHTSYFLFSRYATTVDYEASPASSALNVTTDEAETLPAPTITSAEYVKPNLNIAFTLPEASAANTISKVKLNLEQTDAATVKASYESSAVTSPLVLDEKDLNWAAAEQTIIPGKQYSLSLLAYGEASGWGEVSAKYGLSIGNAPVFTRHPTSLRVLEGSNAVFTIEYDTSKAYTLQWQVYAPQSTGFIDIPAAATATYAVSAVSYSENGTKFRAILTDNTSKISTLSHVATLNVTPSQALISKDPQSIQVQAGESAQFQAGFTSVRECSYAWQVKETGSDTFRNLREDEASVVGTANSGADGVDTTTTLTLSPVSAAMHAYQYRLFVKDELAATEALSLSATLTVSSPSTLIVKQPQRQRVAIGEQATFSVELGSVGAYAYQWQVREATSGSFSDITGAVGASYSTPSATAAMNGNRYRVQIRQEDSQEVLETSQSVSLIVYEGDSPPFRITDNLHDQEVTEGDTFSFRIELDGSVSNLAYQWQVLKPGASHFSNIDGATNDTYGSTAAIDMDESLFRVFIHDANNVSHSLYSESAKLDVLYKLPQITASPKNQRIREGGDATFTASWSAAPTGIEYSTEWLIDLPNDALNFIPISSTDITYETSESGSTSTLVLRDTAYDFDQSLFMLLIRNAADTGSSSRSINSDAARLEIITGAPAITQQPITKSIHEGETATFSVKATGRNLHYQWYVSEDHGHSRIAITGATSANFTTSTATLSMHGYLYSVEVSNGIESAHSQAAELQVSPIQYAAPIITVEPQDQRVYSGTRATFAVSATGNPAPSYQWQLSTDGGTTFTDIDQATSSSYQTDNTYYAMNGWKYRVIVSNSQGNVVSRPANLSTYSSSSYVPPNPPNNNTSNNSSSTNEIPKLSIGGMEITVTRVNDSRVRLALSDSQIKTLAERRDTTITFDIDSVSNASSVDLPCRTLQRLGSADKTIEFLFDDGSLSLSPEAAEFLADIAASGTANITIQEVNSRSLTSRQREIVGDNTVFKAEIKINNETISDLEGEEVELGFFYLLSSSQSENGLKLYHLDGDELQELSSWYDHNNRTLKTSLDHLSYFVVGYEEPPRVDIEEPNQPPRTDIPHENEPEQIEEPTWHNPFNDVKQSDWFYNSLAYVIENNLFVGTSDTTFEPNIPMTRGMLVCVLARLDGANLSSYSTSSFSDVALGSYYLSSIEWAFAHNIVNGVGNGLFEPDRAISREELMAIFSNYLEIRGYELPQQGGQEAFDDQAQISAWAAGSVARMQGIGLAGGRGNNLFAPKETATRAEVASLVERFATQLKSMS